MERGRAMGQGVDVAGVVPLRPNPTAPDAVLERGSTCIIDLRS